VQTQKNTLSLLYGSAQLRSAAPKPTMGLKVLVIGSGFAGATAAIQLSKNKSLEVTLVSR
jgi:heterodisulfide reductase subunit A-like polyferredoxin